MKKVNPYDLYPDSERSMANKKTLTWSQVRDTIVNRMEQQAEGYTVGEVLLALLEELENKCH